MSDMEVIRPFPLDPWQRSLKELIATVGSEMHELHEAGPSLVVRQRQRPQ